MHRSASDHGESSPKRAAGETARRRQASSRSAAKSVRIEPVETVPMTPAEYEAAVKALAVLIARWWREHPEDAP